MIKVGCCKRCEVVIFRSLFTEELKTKHFLSFSTFLAIEEIDKIKEDIKKGVKGGKESKDKRQIRKEQGGK